MPDLDRFLALCTGMEIFAWFLVLAEIKRCSKVQLNFQAGFLGRSFITFGADEWLFSCVCPFVHSGMLLQVTTVVEFIVTFVVGEWLSSRVDPFVHY